MSNADEMAVNRQARANDEYSDSGASAGSAGAGQTTWDASADTVDDGVRQTVAGPERVAGPQAKETGNVKGGGTLSPTASDDDSIDVLTTGGTGGAGTPEGREGTFEGAGRSYGDADALMDDDRG